MALAIFDLDETLISCDSDHEWGKYIIEQGLVDRESHQQKNDIFYQQYKNGELDVDEYFKFACGVYIVAPGCLSPCSTGLWIEFLLWHLFSASSIRPSFGIEARRQGY